MTTLTERQIAILKAVVEEYIETARPVSSDRLEKKYGLGVSPATIRNEMSDLVEAGYLQKSHVSSGRAPTPLGLKFYVHNLLRPQEVSVKDEVGIKERIWQHRQEKDRLIREATMELARRSGALSLAIGPDEEFYLAGLANILNFPEFWDIDLTQSLLSVLDNYSFWQNLINKEGEEMPVYVLLGDNANEVINLIEDLVSDIQVDNSTVDFDKEFSQNYDTLIRLVIEVIKLNYFDSFQRLVTNFQAQ